MCKKVFLDVKNIPDYTMLYCIMISIMSLWHGDRLQLRVFHSIYRVLPPNHKRGEKKTRKPIGRVFLPTVPSYWISSSLKDSLMDQKERNHHTFTNYAFLPFSLEEEADRIIVIFTWLYEKRSNFSHRHCLLSQPLICIIFLYLSNTLSQLDENTMGASQFLSFLSSCSRSMIICSSYCILCSIIYHQI